jgi:hypothetical protein
MRSKKEDVGVEANLSQEVWDHGVRVLLLDLTRQMALCHPRNAVAQLIGSLNLFKKVLEHFSFGRLHSVDGGLADGKEDIEEH